MAYKIEETRSDGGNVTNSQPDGGNAALGSAMDFSFKCLGSRPMAFRGSELAIAMSYSAEMPYWYEIGLYRTVEQEFVVAIKLFHTSADYRDTAQCWKSKTLDGALSLIEEYDAAQDVNVAPVPDPNRASAVECAAYAWDLRGRMGEMRRHYRGLAGEFLHDISDGN